MKSKNSSKEDLFTLSDTFTKVTNDVTDILIWDSLNSISSRSSIMPGTTTNSTNSSIWKFPEITSVVRPNHPRIKIRYVADLCGYEISYDPWYI